MRHQSLILALTVLSCPLMIRSADQEQKTSVTATAKQTDNLSPASDGVYSSTDYCSPSNDNWDAKDSTSTSFGYFSIGVGYTNLKNSFSNTSFTNTQPKFLGNPETNVSNPNYGDGMSLTTEDYVKLSPSSVIGSFEFGYNAALGQTKAFLGFFGGLKVFNASSSFPVFLTSVDYEVGEESGALIIEPESESTISAEYQTIISSRLSFNAGVLFGYKFNDRLFGYAKFGWTCLRTTSSKADESISGNGVVSSGYSPIYTNGLIYGFGVDLSITERLSIGVEAFGESYADRKMAVFAYQSNPGPQTQNSATSFGSSPSIQKLSADPMATTVLGVMLKLNIKFLER